MTTIKATSFECGAIAFVSKQGGGANQNGKKWHVKRNRGELCRVRFLLFFFLTPLCIFIAERRLPNTARFLPVPRAGTVFPHAVRSLFFLDAAVVVARSFSSLRGRVSGGGRGAFLRPPSGGGEGERGSGSTPRFRPKGQRGRGGSEKGQVGVREGRRKKAKRVKFRCSYALMLLRVFLGTKLDSAMLSAFLT